MKYGTTNQQSNSLCEVQRYKAGQKITLISACHTLEENIGTEMYYK